MIIDGFANERYISNLPDKYKIKKTHHTSQKELKERIRDVEIPYNKTLKKKSLQRSHLDSSERISNNDKLVDWKEYKKELADMFQLLLNEDYYEIQKLPTGIYYSFHDCVEQCMNHIIFNELTNTIQSELREYNSGTKPKHNLRDNSCDKQIASGNTSYHDSLIYNESKKKEEQRRRRIDHMMCIRKLKKKDNFTMNLPVVRENKIYRKYKNINIEKDAVAKKTEKKYDQKKEDKT